MARKTVNLELTPAANAAIDELVIRTGMKKRELIGRCMEWFVNQSQDFQAVVFGHISPPMAAMILRQLADQLDSQPAQETVVT